MKPIIGLSKDHKLYEQPPGTYPYGKNGIVTGNKRAIQNEHGFRLSSAAIPYTVMGIITTDSNTVIFSTDNTYSAIGFYDKEKDIYVPIVNDTNLPYKLTFNTEHPIIGEARRGIKNQIEIAFLDGLNPVRFMNTVTPPDDLRGYLLFPEFGVPQIDLFSFDGGSVAVGAYYAAVHYINTDGTETRYVTASSPIFATANNYGGIPGGSSGKTLKVQLTNLDQSYDFVQVALIRKIKGVVLVIVLDKVVTADVVEVYYTGNEGDDLTLEEVLIPAAFYKNAHNITQLQDTLYLADIEEAEVINMQKWANLIRIKWHSEFIANLEANEDVKSGKIKTFKHGEVIDCYVVYHIRNGKKTDAFHIPGQAPFASDVEQDPTCTELGITAKRYQVDARGIDFDPDTRTGYTGVWVNSDENYPNTDDFNSEGLDLRGTPVRHHKMPTIAQMVKHFYGKYPEYGTTGLDALGIKAENVIIPIEYKDVIVGYELYYAKRSYGNSTVIGGGMPLYGSVSQRTNSEKGEVFFNGGNWTSDVCESDGSPGRDGSRALTLWGSYAKLNHPDLMLNKPAITPAIQLVNYKLQAPLGVKALIRDEVDETNMMVDYTTKASRSAYVLPIRGIKKSGYIANNASVDKIRNIKSEDGYYLEFLPDEFITYGQSDDDMSVRVKIARARDIGEDPQFPAFEQAFNVDLVSIKDNMYLGFSNQELVRTNVIHDVRFTDDTYAYTGDCFLVVYSYVSYGLSNSLDRFPVAPPAGTDGLKDGGLFGEETDTYTDEFYLGTSGGKNIRKFVTESTTNLWQRYEDPAMPTSKFFPASGQDLVNQMDRNKDNNFIALSKEANSVGDLLNGIEPYSVDKIRVTESPYKVIRSNKQSKENKFNSWKNFNPLDYYEADKNMGRIMNLQGMDDKLIIHHRNALYLTRDVGTLKTDILSVTLGSGDIFRIAPQQGKPSKTGYAGTQHRLACVLTDIGYVFPDAETGILYIVNNDGLNPLNNDLSNFLLEYLNVEGVNPYVGNGITIGYDADFKRLLLTVKNKRFTNYVPGYEATAEFYSKLTAGESIVLKDGRYQLFKGVNTSEFDCTVYTNPILPNYETTIPEFSIEGLDVGTVVASGGTPGYMYTIISGNTNGAFVLNSLTGLLEVANSLQLDRTLQTFFTLTIKVTDTKGKTDTGTYLINLSAVQLPPETTDYILEVNEFIPNDTVIQAIESSDPRDLVLTHTLESQSVAGAVKVNAAGVLSVNDTTKFIIANPVITVVVRVTNSVGLFVFSNITIFMVKVNRPPVGYDKTVTILDTATGEIMQYDEPTDPDEPSSNLKQTVVSQTVPFMFTVNTELRTVTLNPGFILDPEEGPYLIQMLVEDTGDPTLSDTFTLTINVLYDPTTLISEPYDSVCDSRIIFEVVDYFVFDYIADNTEIIDVNQSATNYSAFYININEASPLNPSGAVAPLMVNAYAKKANSNTEHKNSNYLNFKKIKETFLDPTSLPTTVFISSGCVFGSVDEEDVLKIRVKGYIGGTMIETSTGFENVGGLLKIDLELERWIKYSGGIINIVYVKNDRENFLQFQ